MKKRENKVFPCFFPKTKKGQLTIFIIIAVAVVALGVLIFLFYPQISSSLGFGEKSPSEFIQSCLEKDLKNTVDILSSQGGKVNPEHYFSYNGDNIEYLCYISEYYKTCVMQQPMLKSSIEKEIENATRAKGDECFSELKKSYEKKGYAVSLTKGDISVELLPNRIVVTFLSALVLTKEATENYNSIRVVLNNNLYELISIANSILNWEARYGDSETTVYMNYYHNLKVEKKKQSDGTKIYILTERDTKNKFQFASRSVAWPPGYGASGVLI